MKNKSLLVIVLVAIVFAGLFIAFSYFNNARGSVFIDSFPQGSEVYIDGVLKGKTPVTINNLDFGEYEIQVKHDGFRTFTKTIDLLRSKNKITVIANLEHITFVLQVSSYPTEAEVYVDGVRKGLTPITINDLSLGEHFVEVKKENFSTWSQKINVDQYKVIQLLANLEATAASIDINSTPSGATVLLNGEAMGVTPIVLKDLDAGDYTLELKFEGYAPYSEKLTLNKGETVQRNVTLEKANTVLSIDSNPSGAEIFIDGKDMGKTPYKAVNIKPGIYKVEIKKDGYLPFTTQVKVEKDKPAEFVFPLLKLPSSNNP
jgi:hypothetical protein